MSDLKTKLENREVTLGSWITLGHASIAEIMADAGFEWLTVDMEHSVITLEIAQMLIQIIEGSNVTPLVRVGKNDPNLIKRVMDTGSTGVIVPKVNTEEQARKAVDAVKYPPKGARGVGLARAQGYGANFEEYASSVNEESVVITQVEHIKAVENLKDILSVNGVDGCIVGPYDISASLGVPGEFKNPKVEDALKKVELICQEENTTLGYHVIPPEHEKVLEKVSEGYNFLAFSLDILFLGESCRKQLKKLREEISSKIEATE